MIMSGRENSLVQTCKYNNIHNLIINSFAFNNNDNFNNKNTKYDLFIIVRMIFDIMKVILICRRLKYPTESENS